MKRKVTKILCLIPVLYIIIIPVFMAYSSGSVLCSGVSIDLKDSAAYHFVTKRNLLNIVHSSGKILGMPVRDIPVAGIEERIRGIREIRSAEVYADIDGTIHVHAVQRNPVMRVIPDSGGDFFIDEDGVLVRKRNLYNPRLHIVGGDITITQKMLDGISILDTAIKKSVLKDIFYMVEYIKDDNFWSAQIDQIYVDDNTGIDLIPRVGSHIIRIGTTENLDSKLRNLRAFYDKVLPEVGWNKYSLINLEYKDQIVCKRRQ